MRKTGGAIAGDPPTKPSKSPTIREGRGEKRCKIKNAVFAWIGFPGLGRLSFSIHFGMSELSTLMFVSLVGWEVDAYGCRDGLAGWWLAK